jgi:rhamnose transport system permease protein
MTTTASRPIRPRPPTGARRSPRSLLGTWSNALAVLTVALFLVAAGSVDGFNSAANLSQVAAGIAEKGLMMLPLAMIIIAREIDLSVASMAGLASVVFGSLVAGGWSPGPAALAALVVGGLCGAFNGFFVAYCHLPSLIVTLGSLALFRGLCYVILESESISTFPASVTDFGLGYIAGTWIPLVVVPLIIAIPVFGVVLHATSTGRRIFAIGGSPSVALYSAVRVARLKFLLFVVSGLVCALAGIIYSARLSSARADNLFGFELDVITIVFLGGVSSLGGIGRISGVVWALGLVAILRNYLGLQDVGGDAQTTAVGLLLIVSLLIAGLVTRFSARRRSMTRQAGRDPLTAPAGEPVDP